MTMEERSLVPYKTIRRFPNTSREVFGILFRHRRLVVISFLATLGGVVFATLLFGTHYEAHTKILVKHQRSNNIISPDGSSREDSREEDKARARDINTEVELLKSRDLLSQVVQSSQMDSSGKHFWSSWFHGWTGTDSNNEDTAKAVRKLEKKLIVEPIPESNIIRVSYSSHDPELAASVLRNLDNLYIAKHIAVNRPAGMMDFFQGQTQLYQEELSKAESRLASFTLEQSAAAPDLMRDILLKKASEFDADVRQTQASIHEANRRINALTKELSGTPSRLTTQQTTSDNPQLMAALKSTLQDLELKRTDLLEKYQPEYRLVKENDNQINQVRSAIEGAEKNPIRQDTTDQNPTFQMLQSELAKSRAEIAGLRAKAAATRPVVNSYTKEALLLDQKNLKHQDLLRDVKTAEANYLLYLQKGEQARISDAMDKDRILNVAVSEAATVPVLPVTSPSVMILAGALLALMVSTGAAFSVDYLDPSFRTPDEVIRYLEVPVLAAFPKNGDAPRYALTPGESEIHIVEQTPGNTRRVPRFSWMRRNGN